MKHDFISTKKDLQNFGVWRLLPLVVKQENENCELDWRFRKTGSISFKDEWRSYWELNLVLQRWKLIPDITYNVKEGSGNQRFWYLSN